MSYLRPGIGNFQKGSPPYNALPLDVDRREDVQIFLLYPGTSRHDQLAIHHALEDEIRLWARAARVESEILPPVTAEITGSI